MALAMTAAAPQASALLIRSMVLVVMAEAATIGFLSLSGPSVRREDQPFSPSVKRPVTVSYSLVLAY